MLAVGLLVLSLVASGVSKPMARSLRLHETRSAIPPGFSHVGSADADAILDLRLGLVSSNIDELIETLYDVSTPSSANYGQHLSRSEAAAFLAPSTESLQAVNAWLDENNITATSVSPGGDWLAISVPVQQANELLDTNLSVFVHDESGSEFIRALQYSIPADLVGHLQLVHPITTFTRPIDPSPLHARKLAIDEANQRRDNVECVNYITPKCLQELYGIPTTPIQNNNTPSVVTGYSQQYANSDDTYLFMKKYRTDVSPQTTVSHVLLDGSYWDPINPGSEANLDVQYTVGVATDVPVLFVSVGLDYNDGVYGFLDTANYVLANASDAFIMTTSYGGNESDISTAAFSKLCDTYAALGAAGVSVLFASGDGGVSGLHPVDGCTVFIPTFPSGCPYVTSVGGTTGSNPETAASFSGGGFSNVYTTPSFQSADVSAFISTLGDTYSGLYNASGRGFPDVSTQSEAFAVAWNDEVIALDGTSAASPTFASVVALLNDQLLSAGKSKLGWLNPWLYSNAGALNDITSGANPGCGTNGFTAGSGWDPVTGLGTPNFTALKTAAGL